MMSALISQLRLSVRSWVLSHLNTNELLSSHEHHSPNELLSSHDRHKLSLLRCGLERLLQTSTITTLIIFGLLASLTRYLSLRPMPVCSA
jgi:hypothetical protein